VITDYDDLRAGSPTRPTPVPEDPWVMAQEWEHVLFLHWRVDPDRIRVLLPAGLDVQTMDGSAWISLVPLHMADIHLRYLPPVVHFNHFAELNLRTYVTHDGQPGVRFIRILAANRPSSWIGRNLFHTPYQNAAAALHAEGAGFHFTCRRGRAGLDVSYHGAGDFFAPQPGSLELFLTERYAMYVTGRTGRLYCGAIQHSPWEIQPAEVDVITDPVLDVNGFGDLGRPTSAYFSAGTRSVVWALERV
jgi:uncharacterized protein YqjF (DUF2071 family)